MLLPTPVPQVTTDGTVPVTTTVPAPPRVVYYPCVLGPRILPVGFVTPPFTAYAVLTAIVPAPTQDPQLIRRLTVTGPAGSTAYVWIGLTTGVVAVGNLVDVTRRGDLDLATYDPPLVVPVGSQLFVTWDPYFTWVGPPQPTPTVADVAGAGGLRVERA